MGNISCPWWCSHSGGSFFIGERQSSKVISLVQIPRHNTPRFFLGSSIARNDKSAIQRARFQDLRNNRFMLLPEKVDAETLVQSFGHCAEANPFIITMALKNRGLYLFLSSFDSFSRSTNPKYVEGKAIWRAKERIRNQNLRPKMLEWRRKQTSPNHLPTIVRASHSILDGSPDEGTMQRE